MYWNKTGPKFFFQFDYCCTKYGWMKRPPVKLFDPKEFIVLQSQNGFLLTFEWLVEKQAPTFVIGKGKQSEHCIYCLCLGEYQ